MEQNILKVSLKQYKEQIDELRASLLGLEKDSEEYNRIVKEISERQHKLDDALKAGRKDIDGAAGSYNALVKEMANLKKEWRSTGSEIERAKIGEKINSINDRLKSMDYSIGNYQRNVGAYSSAWKDGFAQISSSMGGAANSVAGMITPVKGLSGAFTMLKAAMGWIGLVIAAAVALFEGLSKGISSSEQSSERLEKALAPLRAVLDLVNIGLQKMGAAFMDVVEWVGKATTKVYEFLEQNSALFKMFSDWFKTTEFYEAVAEKIETNNELTKESIRLKHLEREAVEENAKAEAKYDELMAKATNRDKYNAAERKKYLQEAYEYRKEIAKRELAIANQRLKVEELDSSRTDNDAEANERLAKARAEVTKATAGLDRVEREYNEKVRSYNKENDAESAKIEAERLKLAEARRKETEQAEKEAADAARKQAETERQIAQMRYENAVQGSREQADLQIAIERDKYEQKKALAETEIKDEEQRTRYLEELNIQFLNKVNSINGKQRGSIFADLFEDYQNKLSKLPSTTENTLQNTVEKYTAAIDLTKQMIADNLGDGFGLSLDELVTINEADLGADVLEKLKQSLFLDGEDFDEFQMRINGYIKALKDAKNAQEEATNSKVGAQAKKNMKNVMASATATASVFDTVAGMMQDNINKQLEAGEISEKEAQKQFERTKALQYAATWINTLAAVSQIMSDSSIPSYWVKVPLAAAQLATGLANTMAIKNTEIGSASTEGASAGSVSTLSTASVTPLLNESTDLMNMSSVSLSGEQNSTTKVYVLEQDITSAQTKASVRDSDTSF